MKNIVRNIFKKWYIYLAVILVSSFAMIYMVKLIDMPRNEETISLFVGACDFDSSKLYNKLDANKPNYLREIDIKEAIYYSNDFDYFYSAQGKENTDIIILPLSKCSEKIIKSYYTVLDTQYVEETLSSVTYYESSDNYKYGIKIRNKGDKNNNLIAYYDETHDEDYYMFFGRSSLHAGKNNNSNWNTSLAFAKIIMAN